MNKILLIFINQLKDTASFDKIILDLEGQGYEIYLYDDVNSDSLMYTDLPEICKFYNKSKSTKFVILSNIRDLTFFWYRCYNQLIDDFIYIVEDEEVNFFHEEDAFYRAYYNIFEFNNINNEIIDGRIYLTQKSNIILPLFYQSKYFQLYDKFDFNRESNKSSFNKSYEFIDYNFDFNILENDCRESILLDKIDIRIVFFKGQSSYDVLRVITDYYLEFIKNLGFETDLVDFQIGDESKLSEKLIYKKADLVFSTNCIGIDINYTDGKKLFDIINTPFIGMLGDHPVNHYSRIENAPLNALYMCLDNENIEYFSKYYPDKKIITNYALGFQSKNYTEKNFQEREIEILFIGSISEPETLLKSLQSHEPLILEIVTNISDKILNSNKMLNIDEELLPYLKHYGFSNYVKAFFHSTIERYIRNYKRYHLVKHLGESGLNVVCIGNKDIYNKLNVTGNLDVCDPVGYQEMLDLQNNCKILINMTGQLNHGVTERILSAMINGAAVVTEADSFTTSHFIHSENIILYDYNKLDAMVNDIKMYLEDMNKLEQIAFNGQQLAINCYDFRKSASKFPRLVRELDRNFSKEMGE